MVVTPETVRRVIRSWLAIEVLTPHRIKAGWSGLAADRHGQLRAESPLAPNDPGEPDMPDDYDEIPWAADASETPDDPDPDDEADTQPKRPWYLVVLGASPARLAFEHLDAAFSEAADDGETGRVTEGDIVAATAVIDQSGFLVPDTIAVASFAWGLGHLLSGGSPADMAAWDDQEGDLKARAASILTPTDQLGRPQPLTWRDLRDASRDLGDELRLPAELWQVTPCAIRIMARHPPLAEVLSGFVLSDLRRVLREADQLPAALSSYLGLNPPRQPRDALTDRVGLASLLEPGLFPLGRWPGPGLHALNVLQQAAVNAIVRDLDRGGLAAVNGPPGTGKTTLLRDLVARVLVSRADALAQTDPLGDLSGLDLMDFAMVAASNNNTAVENISLELPLRAKALDRSVWRDGGLEYFRHTADAVGNLPPGTAEQDRAWGLMAARLGKARHRKAFFATFWWDPDWGLKDWLDLAGWPANWQDQPMGKLAGLDPPPPWPEARANWRRAVDEFCLARDRCRRFRDELEGIHATGSELTRIEAQKPAARGRLDVAERDLASAGLAAEAARIEYDTLAKQVATEQAKLAALSSVAPSRFARLFQTPSWRAHEAAIREQVARLDAAQDATRAAAGRLAEAAATEAQCASTCQAARRDLEALVARAAGLALTLKDTPSAAGDALPGPGFWEQPDADLHRAAPWNGGAFRDARDALFVAAVRLHRAFIVAAARRIKPALNAVARAAVNPSAPRPEAADWGLFFLVVPVVSTTFASVGRMFQGFGAAELGWLLIDEAGQAAPQAAVGAIWRARRAVVIGDPLQIEPVVTTPARTTRLIFESHHAEAAPWSAPEQSAQTLADRASAIQGRFRVADGEPGREERITGMPLLVHRRCEQPMFGLANAIAYDNRMVYATVAEASPIRAHLGPSAWIDVDAPSRDKWVPAEGELIAAAIAGLCGVLRGAPDLFVICPFRQPAADLRALLLRTPGVLPGLKKTVREAWIDRRIGTVHTFQGKEAEAVILMLGAGRGAREGSRTWAGRTPNLLNVAATRARRALYVVGNRAEWQGAGFFREAARLLPHRSGRDWFPGEGDS
nr:AAA domain-containing protein [uncultured Rhodopila sp.]